MFTIGSGTISKEKNPSLKKLLVVTRPKIDTLGEVYFASKVVLNTQISTGSPWGH